MYIMKIFRHKSAIVISLLASHKCLQADSKKASFIFILSSCLPDASAKHNWTIGLMSLHPKHFFSPTTASRFFLGMSLFCFFSNLFSFQQFFSDLFCSIFCLKDPNFAHIFQSSQTFVTALLEYFVYGVCSIGVLVKTGDCSITVS